VEVNDIGLGRIHVELPTTFSKVADLPDAAGLDHDGRAFLASCGIRTIGVLDEEADALSARAVTALASVPSAVPDTLIMVAPRAPDVLLGSCATRAQAAAGLAGTVALTLDGLGCAGSSGAWGLAADLLRADQRRMSVAIAHASRPAGVARIRPPVSVIGDGAFAMTVERGGSPVLRAHRMSTDGMFHDLFRVDYKQGPWYEWREECASPDRYRFELALHSREHLGSLTRAVLDDAGRKLADVDALVMQNVSASAFEFHESMVGLPVHPACRDNLARHGHLGAMDVVLNLRDVLESGDIAQGGLILVLNSSPVAAWAATLWEVT
jgi:3-oxoacyl-[acyl-carrier-protein] synthase III